jgi:hypothetical protein
MAADHYATLGIHRLATPEQIKHAYREQAKRLHPTAIHRPRRPAVSSPCNTHTRPCATPSCGWPMMRASTPRNTATTATDHIKRALKLRPEQWMNPI